MKAFVGRLASKAKRRFAATLVGSILIAASPLPASPTQLLSARNPSLAPPAGGNGDSVAPRISGDGRFVVFSSSADNLVTNANGQFKLNVLLRDCVSNTTTLVSINSRGNGGGDGDSVSGQVSSNGQFVVFQSEAGDLVPGDTNGVSDIFARNVWAGTTILVSMAADGGLANGASVEPVLTPDGRYVAFVSSANNLATGVTNGIPNLFVRDLVRETTICVTAGAAGTNVTVDTPAITPDGRYVAFFSTATNLVPGVPAASQGEIYLADLVSNKLMWASTNAAVSVSNLLHLANMPSSHPVLSDDGRYVAFKCGWTNGTVSPGGSGAPATLFFQYDSVNGTTTILTTNGYASWAFCDDVYGPETTPDGRFVAYGQREPAGITNYSSIRLWDRQTGTNVLASAGPDGLWPTNSTSHTPALSADGRYVTFLSDATNLVGNVVSNGLHIYRRDLQAGVTVLLDADTNGVGSQDELGAIPSLSTDGSHAAFSAPDGGLTDADNNDAADVFLWDATAGTNELVSVRNPPAAVVAGDKASSWGPISMSGDGTRVVFASFASDLTANDFNRDCDVFVRDRGANDNLLASVGLDGNAGLGGPSYNPIISTDGRYVIFFSGATNLVAGDTNGTGGVFRRDLQLGITERVNVDSSGMRIGTNNYLFPACSQDGRYVAFVCCTNISSAVTNVFWRDMSAGATYSVCGNTALGKPISLSADGQRLAYFDKLSRLYVWDADALANIYTNTTAGLTSAVLSPAGDRLLYGTTNQLFVYDLAGASTLCTFPSTVQLTGSSPWSKDGRYIAFATASGLVPGDTNGTNDIYLCDLQTGTLTLASVNQDGDGSANGASDSPAISADGRFVVYRTLASDAAPGIIAPPSLVTFDRLTGTNSLLATGTTDGWTTWLAQPVFSTNNTSVAFQSWDSGLVAGDLNRAGDVFAGDVQVFAVTNSINPDFIVTYQSGAGVSGPGGGGGMLSWSAVPGCSYQVWSTTNLSQPVWQAFPGNATVIGNHGYFNLQATDTQRYFRILGGN